MATIVIKNCNNKISECEEKGICSASAGKRSLAAGALNESVSKGLVNGSSYNKPNDIKNKIQIKSFDYNSSIEMPKTSIENNQMQFNNCLKNFRLKSFNKTADIFDSKKSLSISFGDSPKSTADQTKYQIGTSVEKTLSIL